MVGEIVERDDRTRLEKVKWYAEKRRSLMREKRETMRVLEVMSRRLDGDLKEGKRDGRLDKMRSMMMTRGTSEGSIRKQEGGIGALRSMAEGEESKLLLLNKDLKNIGENLVYELARMTYEERLKFVKMNSKKRIIPDFGAKNKSALAQIEEKILFAIACAGAAHPSAPAVDLTAVMAGDTARRRSATEIVDGMVNTLRKINKSLESSTFS